MLLASSGIVPGRVRELAGFSEFSPSGRGTCPPVEAADGDECGLGDAGQRFVFVVRWQNYEIYSTGQRPDSTVS